MTTLTSLLLGATLLYVGYLHLQLHINRRILKAFQASTIVVPPHNKKVSDPRIALLALGLLLLSLGVFLSLVQ